MGLGAERRSHRFSAAATARLEEEYARNPIPSRETRCLLARELGVSLRQVQVWLQNKRQRTKAREASKPQDPQLKHDGDASIVRSIPYAEAELPPNGLNMEIFVASYPPFPVLWASMDWLNFCGFNASEISGATLKILQGKRTDKEAAAQLVASSMERCGVPLLATRLNSSQHALSRSDAAARCL